MTSFLSTQHHALGEKEVWERWRQNSFDKRWMDFFQPGTVNLEPLNLKLKTLYSIAWLARSSNSCPPGTVSA